MSREFVREFLGWYRDVDDAAYSRAYLTELLHEGTITWSEFEHLVRLKNLSKEELSREAPHNFNAELDRMEFENRVKRNA